MQSVWKDPVWSKIISALILSAGTGLLSVIKYVLSDHPSDNSCWNVFSMNVPLWMIFAFAIFWGILEFIFRKFQKPAFLKEMSVENVGGFKWTWHWEYDREKEKYIMKELHPLCRKCNNILTIELYDEYYSCIENHSCSIAEVNYIHVKKHILNTIIQKYPQSLNKIHID